MNKPKGSFEAAVRVAAEAIENCEWDAKYLAQTVLSAAFPPDPAPETRYALQAVLGPFPKLIEDVYAALRASLLPGEEPSAD